MIPRRLRVPIKSFPRNAKRRATAFLAVKFTPNSLSYNRFGIIISAKIEKSSARRHLLKRRIAECAKILPNLGNDIIIIPTPAIKSIRTFAELKKEMESVGKLIY